MPSGFIAVAKAIRPTAGHHLRFITAEIANNVNPANTALACPLRNALILSGIAMTVAQSRGRSRSDEKSVRNTCHNPHPSMAAAHNRQMMSATRYGSR